MRAFVAGHLLAMAFALFLLALFNTAWLSDDAYISFRSCDNLIHGYGLTWNVDERVQAFTNPLWVLLNAAAAAFNDASWQIYLSSLALSAGVSLLALLVLAFGVSRGPGPAIIAIVALTFSRAFVDYSTSGLENPMTHLLTALFVWAFLRDRWTTPVLFSMALATGLSALNRVDTVLLFLPVLAYAWLAARSWRATFAMAAGFLPIVAWEVFSIVYYGFPFPNTAYAKLGGGIPAGEIAWQGVWYLKNSVMVDPLTPTLLVLGLLVAPLVLRRWRYALLALGGLLYVAYVVKVGGDFMQGRFLTPPLFLAVLLTTRMPWEKHPRLLTATGFAAVGLNAMFPNAPLFTGNAFHVRSAPDFMDEHQVGDERRFYMFENGLRFWDRHSEFPQHRWAEVGRKSAATGLYSAFRYGTIGLAGYFAGPKAHIEDRFALSDPLLARIPATYLPEWRIGHLIRNAPAWYLKIHTDAAAKLNAAHPKGPALTLEERRAENLLPELPVPNPTKATLPDGRVNPDADPDLMAYYGHLSLIIRGPLFSWERLKTIVAMNLGQYDHLVHKDTYLFAGMKVRNLAQVSKPLPRGTAWNGRGTIPVDGTGIEIRLGDTVHNAHLEFSGDWNEKYRLLFYRAGECAATLDIPRAAGKERGVQTHGVDVPAEVAAGGYDAVRVVPYGGDRYRSFAHLRLL